MDAYGENCSVDEKSDKIEENAENLALNYDEVKTQSFTMLICDPCSFENSEQEAVGFCRNCTEYLCQGCIREHKKAKHTREHDILDENLPKEPEVLKMWNKMLNCKDHPEGRITAKCIKHDIFICVLCIAETHRKCELGEFTTNTVENCKIGQVFEFIDELFINFESAKRKLEERKKSILGEQETIITKLENFVKAVSDTVQSLSEGTLNELREKTTRRLSEAAADIEKCNDIAGAITTHRRVLETAISFGNECDIHTLVDIMNEKLKPFYEDIRNIETKKIGEMQFKSKKYLLSLPSIGELEIKESGNAVPTNCEAQSSDEFQEVKFEDQSVQTVLEDFNSSVDTLISSSMDRTFEQNATVYPVKLGDDEKSCNISGMIVFPGDRLMVSDSGNSAIKLFTNEFSFVASFDLNDTPIDVCKISESTVAVCFLNWKRIQMYEIQDSSISFKNGFNTKLYNLSVARYNSQVAILMSDRKIMFDKGSEEDIIEIQFRDPDNGQCLVTLDDFGSNTSFRSFDLWNPSRIRFNEDDELLIVEPGRVSCFEYDDNMETITLKWYYKPKSNSLGYGIGAIEFDNESVYFCSGTGVIGQVSASNYRHTRFLVQNIISPSSIALDCERKRILVGCYRDNYIHVYHYK